MGAGLRFEFKMSKSAEQPSGAILNSVRQRNPALGAVGSDLLMFYTVSREVVQGQNVVFLVVTGFL